MRCSTGFTLRKWQKEKARSCTFDGGFTNHLKETSTAEKSCLTRHIAAFVREKDLCIRGDKIISTFRG